MQRKLTVIFSADVVGYSSLMERDEAGTLARLKENRKSLFNPCVAAHGGRVFKLMGDGVLIEFPSAASAVTCALEVQRTMEASDAHLPEAERLRYRIGINLGDVIVEGDDIYGDGVNVAARLQALAPVGGIALSRNVSDQVSGKVAAEFEDLGQHTVKNIERPVHVFAARPKFSGVAATPKAAEKKQLAAICVLPFVNMSGDQEQEYFSDGISEDIITDLSKVSALWVAARNTSFLYKGKQVDVPKLARELKVSHVLEGSVRKAGGRVRITAQLIDAGGGHIWAERYDRDLADIFALQDEISEAIVKVLKIKLLPEEKKAIEHRGTNSAQAYKYYLLARQFRAGGNTSNRVHESVIRLCQRAVELDPNYAEAWALIARTEERLNFQGDTSRDGSAAADRALAIDDKLPEAHAVKATVWRRFKKFDEAEREISLALKFGPETFDANAGRASLHFVRGELKEAALFYEKAADLDPSDCTCLGMMGTVYSALGDQEAARRAARRLVGRAEAIVARAPDNCNIISWLVAALGLLGEYESAREWIDRALILDPNDFNMRYNFACALARELSEHEFALDLLEQSFREASEASLNWVKADPDMDPLREHPRFKKMMADAEARLAKASPP
jgi:adenylate cyclase